MIVDLVVDGARFTVTERPGSRGVHDHDLTIWMAARTFPGRPTSQVTDF